MSVAELPVQFTDPINARILEQSEDRIQGFQRDPLGTIAKQSGVELETVIERIRAMLRAGTIRRVRQTLLATNLAQGALVAWEVSENLDAAFDYMFQRDPFSGHVVTRSIRQSAPPALPLCCRAASPAGACARPPERTGASRASSENAGRPSRAQETRNASSSSNPAGL